MKKVIFNLFFLMVLLQSGTAQVPDSVGELPARVQPVAVTIHPIKQLLEKHIFITSSEPVVSAWQKSRNPVSRDLFFYTLLGLMFFLGILRASFPRYFSNLLRVFFNTSLRQSQLTDQLLQARLPALLFNFFFICISGCFLFLLLIHFGKATFQDWRLLIYVTLAVAAVYLGKYLVLLFSGWLTGYRQEAQTYIFIVFLFNKILSLLLVPLTIICAFADPAIAQVARIFSLIILALFFLLRFYRSYGLLQHRLKVSRIHFFLYIIGIELLPILLIYKGALQIMHKSL